MHTRVILKFVEYVSETNDEKLLKTLGVTPREMELVLALLNMIQPNSLVIPNPSSVMKKLRLNPSYLQDLKKKKLVVNGARRGEWGLTEAACKKMLAYLESEGVDMKEDIRQEATPAVEPSVTTAAPATPMAPTTDFKVDISMMTISDIKGRLIEIKTEMDRLQQEYESIKEQVKQKLAEID